MDGLQKNNILKKMTQKLQLQCAGRGSGLSATVVALMVKSVLSDPKNSFNADEALTEEDIQKLEELCLNKLTERCSPSLDTIKMQEYFGLSYTSRSALQSVLPPAELAAFMALLKEDKEQQLDELTRIVAGICLFNKASVNEKCLHETFPVSFEGIENELSASRRLVGKYTTLLEELLQPDSRRVGRDVPVDLLKQALYNARQHEAFLKILLSNAHLCASCMGDLQMKLSAQTNLLKESVKAKRAVHSAKVFPLFKALADLWCGLQEEAELLKVLHTIMLNLQPFTVAQAELFPAEYLDGLLEGSEVKTDQDRLSQPSDGQINLAEMTTCEWLPPETDASISDLSLQFNGFCGYTFVCRDGLLLPGNPKLGVLKHEGKFYAFSSREAALEFASRPDDFIAEVEERAKGSPELLHLFRLQQRDFSFEMCPKENSRVKPITKCESGTQTDVHPVETNVVRTYEWNAWELRRKAIKLANLLTKATHSTQTHASSMRRENATQVWLPKDAASQCKRDAGSNVPRPQVYLTGLRGQRDAQVVKIDLTRAVDE
ncbi:unnamed protein product, partial [Tetraodon nigroviridis]